jgi:hypothetical protein
MTGSDVTLKGSCLCGAVSVEASALPLLTLACHCRDCQKFSASAFSLTAMFLKKSFSHSGELQKGGLHSEQREHYFCSSCKNFIFSRLKTAPERINLRISILDDAASFPPFVELMTDEKVEWANLPVSHSYALFPKTLDELKALMKDYANQSDL